MWITLLIVSLAIAMMLGPIMLMQPSKRQRRLAKLRAGAEARGFKIKMGKMPAKSARAGESVAVYARSWPRPRRLAQTWLLARQTFSHGLHFFEEWDWVDERQAPPAWQSALLAHLPQLPQSVVAVEATGHTLGLYWLEHTGGIEPDAALDGMASWLDSFIADVSAPAAAAQAEARSLAEDQDE